jgi:UDP-MurNAc hydroxylase
MILTYYQSSAVMIEHENVKIFCDPWLVDGEMYGSWCQYPPYKFNPKDFEGVDYIYLSHIHQDHFSKKTLSQMNKNIPVIIFNFKSKSLKMGIESLGFKVIEVNHNERTHLKNNLYINILSADNCNPEICHKYFGCTPLEVKFGFTAIDTMCVIDNNDQVVVNTNDCPYDLSFTASQLIKEKYNHIDLLLVGYTSASAYPQCFTMNLNEKEIAVQKLKKDFLLKAERYVELFKPKYFMPFAGRYTLSGKLSSLNKFKGSSSIEEAYDYFFNSSNIDNEKYQCFLLNPNSSFDINTGKSSDQYSPIDLEKEDEYIIKKLSQKKLDYEYEIEPSDEEILSLIPKAFKRFESKRKEIGFESDTVILIKISDDKLIAISCSGVGFKIISEKDNNFEKFVKLTLDKKLLKWLLQGPRYAYWGTAENGSHIIFEREPNVYERGLYYALSFFYS